jgi:phytoene dehydrogenase-like protein
MRVDVFEAEPRPGGAARTLELTVPGFLHDFGSAVYPLAAGSPFFSSLPLYNYGLHWIHSPLALAHPLDDGSAVTLHRDLATTCRTLGRDAQAWRRLMEPFANHWPIFSAEVLQPVHMLSRHPWLLARFGMSALPPANALSRFLFRGERTKALFAGLAAHSFLSLDEPLSAAFAVLLGAAAHAVGWPIPRGGAQSITDALCGHLSTLGAKIKTSARIEKLQDLGDCDVTLCDVTPRQLLQIANDRLSPKYKRQLAKFRYGCGVFKVDYALGSPIPWKARECLQAATVHVGGSSAEITTSEAAVRNGTEAQRPFVLVAQPSLFDTTRAPAGKHTAWAYCHVPNGSKADMLERLERQIERFAPGFRECVISRRVFSPAALETMDANLIGGDIGGGAMDLRQFLWRPTRHNYATSLRNLYICSSSTPPGGGVHGMCGYHAARAALSGLGR